MQSPSSWTLHREFAAPFDAGERSFSHHYLLCASRGSFYFELAERTWLLPPQRAALIRCGTPIRIWTQEPVTSASVLIAPSEETAIEFDCRVFYMSELAHSMVAYSMRWDQNAAAEDPTSRRFFLALFDVCLELSQRPDHYWLPRAKSKELGRALEFTRNQLSTPLQFGEVASIACVSERTLSRRFSDEINMNWSEYLRRARLIEALDRLSQSTESIAQVAQSCGFESLGAFNIAFKAYTQTTPSGFRRTTAAFAR
jgi:AraC-like DNA-binding protein